MIYKTAISNTRVYESKQDYLEAWIDGNFCQEHAAWIDENFKHAATLKKLSTTSPLKFSSFLSWIVKGSLVK